MQELTERLAAIAKARKEISAKNALIERDRKYWLSKKRDHEAFAKSSGIEAQKCEDTKVKNYEVFNALGDEARAIKEKLQKAKLAG